MATDLIRIGERARKQPEIVFTSLYHHVTDVDNLRACYHQLDDDKAVALINQRYRLSSTLFILDVIKHRITK